jgi:hypothetical protein
MILDFGFWIREQNNAENTLDRISFRKQSKIQNPKSKMGGAFCNRRRAHGVRGEGRGAAAEESSSDRVSIEW